MQEVLTFRPIAPEDASWIAPVLARAELARNTATIPHPLPEGFAARWIAEWQALRAAGDGLRSSPCWVARVRARSRFDAREMPRS